MERIQKSQYIEENYGNATNGQSNRTFATVHVRDDGGNVLSKSSLLTELRYQAEVRENGSLNASLHEGNVWGVSNLVAMRAAEAPNAGLDAQIAALEDASESEVEGLVAETLANDPRAFRYLPADHDPERPTATDKRLLVPLDIGTDGDTATEATAALHESAEARSDAGYFTLGEHEIAEFRNQSVTNLVQLVLPIALLLIVVVLAFSYRDLVDIVVGLMGVVLSVSS